jgi:hypothetical protein
LAQGKWSGSSAAIYELPQTIAELDAKRWAQMATGQGD